MAPVPFRVRPSSDWLIEANELEINPLSRLLQKATIEAHEVVQRPMIVNALITGSVPLELHIQYLICLYFIYTSLEAALEKHADNPVLIPIANAAVLARSQAIEQDLQFFTRLSGREVDEGSANLQRHLSPRVAQALRQYLSRLEALTGNAQTNSCGSGARFSYVPDQPAPELLLAHSYVRYMGDLSGGQAIRKAVAESYKLEDNDGQRFYDFPTAANVAISATPVELIQLKRRFRDGLDVAGHQIDITQKASLLQEANHCFELNVNLFAAFSHDLSATESSVLLSQEEKDPATVAAKPLSFDSVALPAMLCFTTAFLLLRYYQPLHGFVLAALA